MGVGRTFCRGASALKFHFTNSKLRESHFSTKTLTEKDNILRSKEGLRPLPPSSDDHDYRPFLRLVNRKPRQGGTSQDTQFSSLKRRRLLSSVSSFSLLSAKINVVCCVLLNMRCYKVCTSSFLVSKWNHSAAHPANHVLKHSFIRCQLDVTKMHCSVWNTTLKHTLFLDRFQVRQPVFSVLGRILSTSASQIFLALCVFSYFSFRTLINSTFFNLNWGRESVTNVIVLQECLCVFILLKSWTKLYWVSSQFTASLKFIWKFSSCDGICNRAPIWRPAPHCWIRFSYSLYLPLSLSALIINMNIKCTQTNSCSVVGSILSIANYTPRAMKPN